MCTHTHYVLYNPQRVPHKMALFWKNPPGQQRPARVTHTKNTCSSSLVRVVPTQFWGLSAGFPHKNRVILGSNAGKFLLGTRCAGSDRLPPATLGEGGGVPGNYPFCYCHLLSTTCACQRTRAR